MSLPSNPVLEVIQSYRKSLMAEGKISDHAAITRLLSKVKKQIALDSLSQTKAFNDDPRDAARYRAFVDYMIGPDTHLTEHFVNSETKSEFDRIIDKKLLNGHETTN
jgi:hypothetical protein